MTVRSDPPKQGDHDKISAADRFASDIRSVLGDQSGHSYESIRTLVEQCIVHGAEGRWRELYRHVKIALELRRAMESDNAASIDKRDAERRLWQFVLDNEDLA